MKIISPASLSLHAVTKVVAAPVLALQSAGGTFFTRDLHITSERPGSPAITQVITLYGDTAEALALPQELLP